MILQDFLQNSLAIFNKSTISYHWVISAGSEHIGMVKLPLNFLIVAKSIGRHGISLVRFPTKLKNRFWFNQSINDEFKNGLVMYY